MSNLHSESDMRPWRSLSDPTRPATCRLAGVNCQRPIPFGDFCYEHQGFPERAEDDPDRMSPAPGRFVFDRFPNAVSIEAAFCIAASVLSGEGLTGHRNTALALERVADLLGCPEELREEYRRDQWLTAFTHYSTMRAQKCVGSRGELLVSSAGTDRGKMAGMRRVLMASRAEEAMASFAGLPPSYVAALRAEGDVAKAALIAYANEHATTASETPDDPEDVSPEPLSDAAGARFAVLLSASVCGESFIMEGLRESAIFFKRPWVARVQVREAIQRAIDRGTAIIRGELDALAACAPDRKVPAEALPIVCPVCFYRLSSMRSIAMECGMNIGSGSCLGCGSHMQIRAFDAAGQPDAAGGTLRAFRTIEDAEAAAPLPDR